MKANGHHLNGTSNGQATLLSVGQVASRCNLHPNTIRSYCDDGRFEVVRTLGGRGHRRINQRSVEVALGLVDETPREENTEKKTVAYVRVSSAQQRSEGALDRQREFLVNWTKEKYDIIPECYCECSSSFGKRPQLEKLIFSVIEGRIKRIIIKDSSRWSRVPSTSSLLEAICQRYGVEIVIVEDEPDVSEMNTLVLEMANYCTILTARLSSAKSVKVRSFSIEGKGAEIVEREYRKGTAINTIRDMLTKNGVVNPRTGKPISAWKIQQHVNAVFPENVSPIEGANPVDRFLDSEHVIINPNARAEAKLLYSVYKKWAMEEKLPLLGKIQMGMELAKRSFRVTRGGGIRRWHGIGVA